MSVRVQLERNDGVLETTEDLTWVKKWCITEISSKMKEKVFIIKSFKEIPSSIEFSFKLPQNNLRISDKEMLNRQIFSEKYYHCVAEFIDEALQDCGLDINKIKMCFRKVVEIIYPGMLMPVEVELVSESQII